MALLNCHECGNPISSEASACPRCGAPFRVHEVIERMTAAQPIQSSGMPWVIGVFVAVSFLLIIGPWAWSFWNAPVQREAAAQVAADKREEARRLANVRPAMAARQNTEKHTPSYYSSSHGVAAIPVPSDPTAIYSLVAKAGRSPIILITRRDGTSGVSYSKREIDCEVGALRYLGSADTIEGLENSRPDPAMNVPVDGSISAEILAYACGGQ